VPVATILQLQLPELNIYLWTSKIQIKV